MRKRLKSYFTGRMFEKFQFSERQIDRYFQSAISDYKIAIESSVPAVTFRFCYDALIKLAITVCAKNGLKVKARQGHHIELLGKLSDFLENNDIEIIGNEMRGKRNFDLYSGGILISSKETEEYKKWLKPIFANAEDFLY